MDAPDDQPTDDGAATDDHVDRDVVHLRNQSLHGSNVNFPIEMSQTVINNYLNNYFNKGI